MKVEASEVLECLRYGKKSNQYEDSIRSFALTLHFYSPRAYKFVREKFNKHLPDSSTIRSWISNCTGFGEPGICKESLRALSMLANNLKKENDEFLCSLSWDEMHIHKHVHWDDAKKKFVGFITYGSKDKEEQIPVASQALVYFATGVNQNISIPVAHFFISKLNGVEKAYLTREVLRELTNAGVIVTNVSFDGMPNNFTTCTLLGASFKLHNLKPRLLNPFNGKEIQVFPDACHMLKLTRNCLGSEKVLTNGTGQSIEWKYFENLENYRVERNFVTHKLTKKHIQWDKNKMNVKLAAQTYSKSVGESLLYLADQKCHGFEGSEGTAKHALMMDSLFDIFNSSGNSRTGFKNALTQNNSTAVFAFLDEATEYLKSLKLHGKDLLKSKRRTGFKGFLINIISLKRFYELYVGSGRVQEISTFQLSQDLLESFFSRVRSLNGYTENPTVTQFTSAFRKILIHNEIKSSDVANCEDKLNILTVSSQRETKQQYLHSVRDPTQDNNEDIYDTITLNENDFLMNCCEEVTIASIANSIEKKICAVGRFECACAHVLDRNEKVSNLAINDGSHTPCISTHHVCKIANILFNENKNQINFNYEVLLHKAMHCVNFDNIFTDYFECDKSHKIGFIKYIIEEFIRLQATYIAKNVTLAEQKILCRKSLQKQVHFLGQ